MISSMIDQDGGDVHIPLLDGHATDASRIFWTALSSDSLACWSNGLLSVSNGIKPDASATVMTQATATADGLPAVFLDMMVSLDLEVPPPAAVLAALEPHALAVSLDSPAFGLPDPADPSDLALCVAASRIAWEIRDLLVLPAGVDAREMERALHDVGLNALVIGGPAVYSRAKELLSDPDIWMPADDRYTGEEFQDR